MFDDAKEVIIGADDSNTDPKEVHNIPKDANQGHLVDEACDDLVGTNGSHWRFPVTDTHSNEGKISTTPDWCRKDEE